MSGCQNDGWLVQIIIWIDISCTIIIIPGSCQLVCVFMLHQHHSEIHTCISRMCLVCSSSISIVTQLSTCTSIKLQLSDITWSSVQTFYKHCVVHLLTGYIWQGCMYSSDCWWQEIWVQVSACMIKMFMVLHASWVTSYTSATVVLYYVTTKLFNVNYGYLNLLTSA